MMVPKSLALAGVLALFAASTSAQSQSGKVFARYNKPLKSATLDLATGTITHGAVVSNRAPTTTVDFANIDLGGFVGVDSGLGFCDWFDAGVKGYSGNASDLMNSIVFAYCSAKLTPGSGGPGGSVVMGFYEGYALGGGTPTTTVALFTLTGLPGNTASSSFFGGFRCFFIRVFFDPMICFADGPIGYSWNFVDNGTSTINPLGSVLAGTWPFLSCVVSCSGITGQVDGQGMTDFIDEYCPKGVLRSTFSFGTTSGSFTSMSMAIEEATDKVGTVLSMNSATFPNPDTASCDVATVGQPWSASMTLGLQRAKSSQWIMFFGTVKVAPPNGVPIASVQGGLNFGTAKNGRMLLCAINTGGNSVTGIHTGVSGSTSSSPAAVIPKRLALVCNDWCSQAVVLGPVVGDGPGNARLSSMCWGIVGSKL
jgi:hypothetical protein